MSEDPRGRSEPGFGEGPPRVWRALKLHFPGRAARHAPPRLRELAARGPGAGRYVGARRPGAARVPPAVSRTPARLLGPQDGAGPLAALLLTGKSLSELCRRPRAPACRGVAAGPSSRWPRSFNRSSGTWGRPGQGLQAAGPLGAGAGDFPSEVTFPASFYAVHSTIFPLCDLQCSLYFQSPSFCLPFPPFLCETTFSPLKCKSTGLLLFKKQI